MNYQYDIAKIEESVSCTMNHKRFIHTIGVRDISFSLALLNKSDEKKAVLAGLLHDCAKSLSDEALILECEKYELSISEYERRAPYLLHGKLGAYYAKNRYHIEDEDILNAINYHTTGRPNMSVLEKVVFIADYIEPGRADIPHLDTIRTLSFINLDKAVAAILKNTIDYLETNSKLIDTTTLDAYNYYKKYFK